MSETSNLVKKVVILINQNKQKAKEFALEVRQTLNNRSIEVTKIVGVDSLEELKLEDDVDLAICLGGDGTVLSCSRLLHSYSIPMLAVNLGTFGFITEVCKEEWVEAFDAYIKNKAKVSRRLMVKVSVIRDSKRVFVAHGLNEMTIAASGISKMVSLDLFINGTNAGSLRSDGMIVATPTGSTGYSLASGGPILDVALDALIVNPICPFTLSNRPLVVKGDDVVKIKVRDGQRTQISLTVDGQLFFPLEELDYVEVEKSYSKALIIMSPQRNYYEVIRDKLNWSGGMDA
jgi:NAD+ kinase